MCIRTTFDSALISLISHKYNKLTIIYPQIRQNKVRNEEQSNRSWRSDLGPESAITTVPDWAAYGPSATSQLFICS